MAKKIKNGQSFLNVGTQHRKMKSLPWWFQSSVVSHKSYKLNSYKQI